MYFQTFIGGGLWFMVFNVLSTIFQLYRGVSFIGGGNWSTWRKPPTCHKSLTNFITPRHERVEGLMHDI
jgi:hypothetical protein